MKALEYISNIAIPVSILCIVLCGVLEKKKVFDLFLEGTKDGIEIVIKIFPSLIGLFLAIEVIRSSGILDLVIGIISPIISILKIPAEVMPLAILRPISGSAAMAVATDIMKVNGVDSVIGKITSTIMGSTETTIYTIAIYTGVVKIKKTRNILVAALIGDIARNASFCRNLALFVIIFLLTI